jgi:hypothetical protein
MVMLLRDAKRGIFSCPLANTRRLKDSFRYTLWFTHGPVKELARMKEARSHQGSSAHMESTIHIGHWKLGDGEEFNDHGRITINYNLYQSANLYQWVLEEYQEMHGENHPSTVHNTASVFKCQGKYNDALEWY